MLPKSKKTFIGSTKPVTFAPDGIIVLLKETANGVHAIALGSGASGSILSTLRAKETLGTREKDIIAQKAVLSALSVST